MPDPISQTASAPLRESAPRGRYCTYHCGGCGQHFTSLAAFDQHRAGSYDKRRFCRPAHSVRKLRSQLGVCQLAVEDGEPLHLIDVAVWEDGAAVDAARMAFSRSCNRDLGPSRVEVGV